MIGGSIGRHVIAIVLDHVIFDAQRGIEGVAFPIIEARPGGVIVASPVGGSAATRRGNVSHQDEIFGSEVHQTMEVRGAVITRTHGIVLLARRIVIGAEIRLILVIDPFHDFGNVSEGLRTAIEPIEVPRRTINKGHIARNDRFHRHETKHDVMEPFFIEEITHDAAFNNDKGALIEDIPITRLRDIGIGLVRGEITGNPIGESAQIAEGLIF